MPIGHRMITVLTPEHRVELLVPDAMTSADLVPEVLELVGENAGAGGTAPTGTGCEPARIGLWSLGRPGGRALPPDEPLATAGVRNGDGLLLVPDAHEFHPPRILPRLPGTGAEGTRGPWSNVGPRAVLGAVCAVALAASAGLLVGGAGSREALMTAVAGAALWAAPAVLLGRVGAPGPWRAWGATLLALACAPLLLAAAILLPAAGWSGDRVARIAVIALAATAACGLPAVAVPSGLTRLIALGGSAATVPVLLITGVGARAGASLPALACVLVAVDAVLLHRAATVAVALHRFAGSAPAGPAAPGTTAWAGGPRQVLDTGTPDGAARATLAAVQIGVGAALVPAWLLLSGGGAVQRWLLATTVLVAAGQIRMMRRRLHRSLATVTALLGSGALAVVGCSALGSRPAQVAVAWLLAGLALLASAYGGRLVPPPWLLRTGEVVEILAVAAIPPLLATELGLFTVVTTLAHRWVG